MNNASPALPFLPLLHPPIELASSGPGGRLPLDRRVDFPAISFGMLLQLVLAESPYLIVTSTATPAKASPAI